MIVGASGVGPGTSVSQVLPRRRNSSQRPSGRSTSGRSGRWWRKRTRRACWTGSGTGVSSGSASARLEHVIVLVGNPPLEEEICVESVLNEVRSVIGDVLDRGDGSWRAVQDAGLLSLAAPKEHGGEGLGLTEVAVLLHEVGRHAVQVPVWETLACGLLPLVRSGANELQAELVPRIVAGDLLMSQALRGRTTY